MDLGSQRWMLRAAVSIALLAGHLGCFSSMKRGDVAAIQPQSDSPRVGNVYLIRGLIGLFSAGIDKLTTQINDDGIRAHVYQETQDPQIADAIIAKYEKQSQHEPLCLIGHSVGAEDVITIARKLQAHHIDVDLMVCLDATNPTAVPTNVKRCVNYYQSSLMDYLPVLRGLPLKTEPQFAGSMENLNVRGERRDLLEWDTNHVNIDKNEKIHTDIIRRLNDICVQRPAWVKAHTSTTQTALR